MARRYRPGRVNLPVEQWRLTDNQLAWATGQLQSDLGIKLPDPVVTELQDPSGPDRLLDRSQTMRILKSRVEEELRLREVLVAYEGFRTIADKLEARDAQIAQLEMDLFAARDEITRLRQRLQQVTAQPALAESGEGTGR